MLKGIHNHNARATAAGLLLAFTAGLAFAQPLPALPGNAQSGAQTEATAPLSLQKAIALTLEANLDLTVAQREVEAVQGQVLQAQARRNPELAYALEDQRTQTRTQSAQINLPIELGGKRAAQQCSAQQCLAGSGGQTDHEAFLPVFVRKRPL